VEVEGEVEVEGSPAEERDERDDKDERDERDDKDDKDGCRQTRLCSQQGAG
jgi:hypothetical protein